jgi:hypothetical protein
MSDSDYFIVQVDAFEGEEARIDVTDGSGHAIDAVYCIARRDKVSGVLCFVDYGYTTIRAARAAWPDAR